MNKRYMDFIPAGAANPKKGAVASDGKKVSAKAATKATSTKSGAKAVKEVSELDINEMFEARTEKPKAGVSYDARNTKSKVANYQQKFVKTSVEKRPLSKTAYQRKIKEPEVEKELKKEAAPVTIIDKPEKESKVGLVVTIIITVILGAAAGVVAFLLLPK